MGSPVEASYLVQTECAQLREWLKQDPIAVPRNFSQRVVYV